MLASGPPQHTSLQSRRHTLCCARLSFKLPHQERARMPWRHLVFPPEGKTYMSPEFVKTAPAASPIADKTSDIKPTSPTCADSIPRGSQLRTRPAARHGLLGTSAPVSPLGERVPLVPTLPVPKCVMNNPSSNSSPTKAVRSSSSPEN